MRLISLLIGLAIIAYLINKQLTPAPPPSDINTTANSQNIVPPKVPVTPNKVKDFETDINQFVQDAASERNKALEKMEE